MYTYKAIQHELTLIQLKKLIITTWLPRKSRICTAPARVPRAIIRSATAIQDAASPDKSAGTLPPIRWYFNLGSSSSSSSSITESSSSSSSLSSSPSVPFSDEFRDICVWFVNGESPESWVLYSGDCDSVE